MEPCPNCASELTEALRSEGGERVRLRCPECQSCFRGSLGPGAHDVKRRAERQTMLAAYERSVRESMTLLADRLGEALARDLIGADDFARAP